MAVIAPQTDVYLLKVPLEIDNTNQLTFANATAQFNYFNSLPKISYDNFTYQRKDNTIRIPALIDDIIQYNYIMYRNEGFSNKWFYAYIDKMEYLNDGVTAVSITTDVWQTWQFDLTYKPTFVEREHVNDDTIGIHTLPENVELGQFVFNGQATNFGQTAVDDCYIALGVTELIAPFTTDIPLTDQFSVYNGIYSGLNYLFFSSFESLDNTIKHYVANGKTDAIQTIFYVPYSFIANSTTHSKSYNVSFWGSSAVAVVYWVEPSLNPIDENAVSITRPSTLLSYIPRNKKLLTYPYCFFNVTNNVGDEYEYRYEDFTGNPTFQASMALCPSMSIKAVATNYKNGVVDQTWGEGISGAKTPQCSWKSDYYTNWLTQNGVNIGLQALNSSVATGASLATGNMVGAGVGLVGAISNTVSEFYRASIIPDQVHGNINAGDITFTTNKSCFTILPKCIKTEYAKVIDNYFDMFGYKINTVKRPNITGRRNWNYVKTIGCYIEADIPQDDLQSIKNMFDNGVTFWHNASTFADYSQINDII